MVLTSLEFSKNYLAFLILNLYNLFECLDFYKFFNKVNLL